MQAVAHVTVIVYGVLLLAHKVPAIYHCCGKLLFDCKN
ncbi:hypothetical protein M975_0215 [Buttiauxella brennerae ATCC 51605]|uniref:Uncharacterized protein n=1 Tax=Buttiauxella brennerae ATCC 51605 TaxID=1354251 RepID=A0A1B7IX03_9ENTR|nr:hypothetical protein M975_0215 [Buttiauxella brennerae ATCC 51605]